MFLILVLGSFLVVAAVAAFLLRVTKVNYIPAYVTLLAFVAFFIPTFTVILLPIDLASGRADSLSNADDTEKPLSYLSHRVLLKLWRASYWLSFSLTLTILPITQSFVESGYKEPIPRLLSSLRQNLRYQAMYLSIGIFGIIYIVLNTDLHSFADFKSLLIALANTWGLFLAINFLGHGLINVPRRLWKSADYAHQKREVEIRSTLVRDNLDEAITDELELAKQIIALEKTTADKEWLEEMANQIPSAVAMARARQPRQTSGWFGSSSGERISKDPTDVQLAELMQKIRNGKRERYQAEWDQLLVKYTFLVDCTRPSAKGTLNHRTFRTRLSPQVCYWCYVHVLPALRRSLAVFFGLVSFSILWAEILINKEQPFLRFITLPITEWSIEIWSALLLAYMACCCYSTLLRLKIFNRYALLDRGHTSSSSLFFYASYCCRVTIPLSYNYITLLPGQYREYSTFSKFLASAIDLQPLGTAFNNWFPLYILLPVLLTLTNSYDKLRRTFGFSSAWIEDENEEGVGGSAIEGRQRLLGEIAQRYGELPESELPYQRHNRAARDEDEEDEHDDQAPFIRSEFYTSDTVNQHEQGISMWHNMKTHLNHGLLIAQEQVQSIKFSRK